MKKYLLVLLITPLFFTSCSDDDDSCDSFLECNENSVWNLKIEGEEDIYFKFIDNKNDPFNYWNYNDDDNCYSLFSFLTDEDIQITKVIENSKNILKIETLIDSEEKLIWTFTKSEDKIHLKLEYFENNEPDGSDEYNMTKSSVNIDDFTICEEY